MQDIGRYNNIGLTTIANKRETILKNRVATILMGFCAWSCPFWIIIILRCAEPNFFSEYPDTNSRIFETRRKYALVVWKQKICPLIFPIRWFFSIRKEKNLELEGNLDVYNHRRIFGLRSRKQIIFVFCLRNKIIKNVILEYSFSRARAVRQKFLHAQQQNFFARKKVFFKSNGIN